MRKRVAIAFLLAGSAVLPAARPLAQPFAPNQPCLHGRGEQPVDRTRREQAVRMARQINRAEGTASFRGGLQKQYRPLEELRGTVYGIPPTPDGFKLQFYTDGDTYTFSLKDTRDRCGFAVFSDQDGRIYEAVPMPANAQILPAEIP
jgi:hypothetical protein